MPCFANLILAINSKTSLFARHYQTWMTCADWEDADCKNATKSVGIAFVLLYVTSSLSMTYLIKLCQREEITWLFPQTKVHHHPISAAPAAVHLTSAKLQHLLVKGVALRPCRFLLQVLEQVCEQVLCGVLASPGSTACYSIPDKLTALWYKVRSKIVGITQKHVG